MKPICRVGFLRSGLQDCSGAVIQAPSRFDRSVLQVSSLTTSLPLIRSQSSRVSSSAVHRPFTFGTSLKGRLLSHQSVSCKMSAKRQVPGSRPYSTMSGDGAAVTPSVTTNGSVPESVFIHLHTLDLRLHDSPALHLAHSKAKSDIKSFLPVYVFDERRLNLSCIPSFGSLGPVKPGQDLNLEVEEERKRKEKIEAVNSKASPVPGPRTRNAGFHRMGRHRVRFLVEAVLDLRKRYEKKGAKMIVAFGRPEEVVETIVQSLKEDGKRVDGVWMQKEVATEEVWVIRHLRQRLSKHNVELNLVEDSRTLVHPKDLPFKIENTPDVYTHFRKDVEGLREEMLRPSLPEITRLKPSPSLPELRAKGTTLLPDSIETQSILKYLLAPLIVQPDIGDFVSPKPIPVSAKEWQEYTLPPQDPRTAIPFSGGESAALARLDDYLGTTSDGKTGKGQGGHKAQHYKETRNGLLGEGFSTKFSPFLAHGCLSARYAANRVRALEDRLREEKNFPKTVADNTYWILFELLWRDYFYFVSERFSHLPSFSASKRKDLPALEVGSEGGTASTLFNLGGFQESLKPSESKKNLGNWKKFDLTQPDDRARKYFQGQSGVPFLDACIKELSHSGFMSNRGRQNVASFFACDMYIDWRAGAEWFETFLVDHDVYSNWGNWQYQAGVGNDPRASRMFNPIKQANEYDADGEFTRTWIPEISELSDAYLQTPWELSENEKRRILDGKYPWHPLMIQQAWKKHYRHDRKEVHRNALSRSDSYAGNGGGSESSRGQRGRGRGRGRA